jgi:REP element-mobilizing transposase RayT
MRIFPGDIIHVYNRGNNKQQIFFNEDNYNFFVDKVRRHIAPISDILAYCLMPNHFHFLLRANDNSNTPKKIGALESTELQNGFRVLQSSYASAINKRFERTGSLFQQNTKYKLLDDDRYVEACFHYIHQNPLKAGLVDRIENWKYSSFREYIFDEPSGLCNTGLLLQLLDMKRQQFYETSYLVIRDEVREKIFE